MKKIVTCHEYFNNRITYNVCVKKKKKHFSPNLYINFSKWKSFLRDIKSHSDYKC